ncbi:MAG: metallophosphoesterase [Phycisphaerae bacterium]|nr:metallophosphoesterase [Phycisphaerae bacterium]
MAWQSGRIALLALLLGVATWSHAQVPAPPAAPTAPASPATTTVGTEPLRIDGPYISTRGEQVEVLWVAPAGDGERPAVVRETLSKDELAAKRFTCVVDDAARTSFPLEVRAEHPIAPAVWPQPERLLVTSDIEGNFDALVRMLRSQGVVDESLTWTFGANHLLVLGDSVDRGDNVTQVLWLLYKLDGEARAAGGAVHMVLGNHETMLMRGDDRYIAPKYRRLLAETKRPIEDFFSAESELGRWLRSKHALVKIGDDLFVHAGIGPAFLSKKLSIEAANELVRKNLGLTRLDADGVLAIGNDGPLWYRGLVVATEIAPKADAAHVARVVGHYGVRRVIVGHTLVDRMSTDYDGRVVRIDLLHPKSKTDGVARALLIERGSSFVVGDDGSKTAVE